LNFYYPRKNIAENSQKTYDLKLAVSLNHFKALSTIKITVTDNGRIMLKLLDYQPSYP